LQNGTWHRSWVLVTEVIEAKSASLLVATEKKSSISLFANASVPAALNAIGVSDPQLGWSSSGWSSGGYVSLCSPGTPLFRCARVKEPFIGKPSVTLLRAADKDPSKAFTEDPYAGV
jgi:hypothetical protein